MGPLPATRQPRSQLTPAAMTRWIRLRDEEDTWLYYELDDEEWALRQICFTGPDRQPTAAAALAEVLHIRDHHDLVTMQNYERTYGVLAEGSLEGWQDAEEASEITHAEFEQLWVSARHHLAGDG